MFLSTSKSIRKLSWKSIEFKAGATALLQVPLDTNLQKTLEFGNPNPKEYLHYRRYGLDYKDLLSSVGFEVDVNLFYLTLSEADLLRYGIKREPLYLVRKPFSGIEEVQK